MGGGCCHTGEKKVSVPVVLAFVLVFAAMVVAVGESIGLMIDYAARK